MVLRGNNLEIKSGLVFWSNLLVFWSNLYSNPLQMTKCYPRSKERIYLLNTTYKSWNQCFVIFWEALQFEAAMPQLRTFHMGYTPTNTCPTKNPNCRFLGYVAFEFHEIFTSIGNILHITINIKNMLKNMLPLNYGGGKCQVWFVERFPL